MTKSRRSRLMEGIWRFLPVSVILGRSVNRPGAVGVIERKRRNAGADLLRLEFSFWRKFSDDFSRQQESGFRGVVVDRLTFPIACSHSSGHQSQANGVDEFFGIGSLWSVRGSTLVSWWQLSWYGKTHPSRKFLFPSYGDSLAGRLASMRKSCAVRQENFVENFP
jgi:hypothetical protein